MPVHRRLTITCQSANAISRHGAVSEHGAITSLLLAVGVVASTTGCAVAIEADEDTGTVADALRLPAPGDQIPEERPPRRFPSLWELLMESLVDISAGKNHTCVRKFNGNVYCWGMTSYGQAGPGNATCQGGISCVTQPSFTGINAQQVDLAYDHSCVVDSNGQGRCWGANHNAQLGNGAFSISANFPASAQPISYNGAPIAFSQISAGDFSTCGLTAGTGNLFCWGIAGPGAYPTGSAVPTPNPILNSGGILLDRIASVSTWFAGACIQFVLTTGGTENYCFRGADASGRANLDYAFDSGATRISAQTVFACADKTNGTVECFGANLDGQLGDGTTNSSAVPVVVGGGMALHGVSAGQIQACALDPAGTAFCWGNAWDGGSLSPVAVSTPVPLTQLATGEKHACGLGNDGHIYCWGNNAYGQIGNGAWKNTVLAATRANTPS